MRTDPQLLEQILRNLLSNALKYTAKGSILMGCRKKGDHLTIEVWDTGIGVPTSECKAIFNAYHQVAKPAFLNGQGLGLGLSIVQRLGNLLDHRVAVRSTTGKGSVFTVTLPVVAAGHMAPADPAPEPADTPRQTGTILLVEDEDDLRTLLEDVLERDGQRVVTLNSGSEAMAWAAEAEEPPDLLLTDFDLPGGITGLSLAQDLPDVLGCAVPTIILTGDITTETLQAIAATPHDQIAKPVQPEVLLARISNLMTDARATAARATAARVTAAQGADGSSDPDRTTLHVVDDDPVARETTRRLFESEGWAVVAHPSAESFLAAPRPKAGDCLLVDCVLPGMSGVDLLKALQAERATLPAVVLTGHGDIAMAVNAMKAGAADLIEKPASASDLLGSVANATERSTNTRARSTASRVAQKTFADLTKREREVLAKVLTGAPNKVIAHDLGINQRTVENHRAAVMRKTGATSLPDLVRLALAAGHPLKA